MTSSRRLKKIDIIPRISSKNEPIVSFRGENIAQDDIINPFVKNGFFELVDEKKRSEKNRDSSVQGFISNQIDLDQSKSSKRQLEFLLRRPKQQVQYGFDLDI